jgi:hypothetical protein
MNMNREDAMKKLKAKGLLEEFSGGSTHYIITDFGKKFEITPNKVGLSPLGSHLPQYAVWEVVDGVAKEVVDMGDNVEALKRHYKVDEDSVYPVKGA